MATDYFIVVNPVGTEATLVTYDGETATGYQVNTTLVGDDVYQLSSSQVAEVEVDEDIYVGTVAGPQTPEVMFAGSTLGEDHQLGLWQSLGGGIVHTYEDYDSEADEYTIAHVLVSLPSGAVTSLPGSRAPRGVDNQEKNELHGGDIDLDGFAAHGLVTPEDVLVQVDSETSSAEVWHGLIAYVPIERESPEPGDPVTEMVTFNRRLDAQVVDGAWRFFHDYDDDDEFFGEIPWKSVQFHWTWDDEPDPEEYAIRVHAFQGGEETLVGGPFDVGDSPEPILQLGVLWEYAQDSYHGSDIGGGVPDGLYFEVDDGSGVDPLDKYLDLSEVWITASWEEEVTTFPDTILLHPVSQYTFMGLGGAAPETTDYDPIPSAQIGGVGTDAGMSQSWFGGLAGDWSAIWGELSTTYYESLGREGRDHFSITVHLVPPVLITGVMGPGRREFWPIVQLPARPILHRYRLADAEAPIG